MRKKRIVKILISIIGAMLLSRCAVPQFLSLCGCDSYVLSIYNSHKRKNSNDQGGNICFYDCSFVPRFRSPRYMSELIKYKIMIRRKLMKLYIRSSQNGFIYFVKFNFIFMIQNYSKKYLNIYCVYETGFNNAFLVNTKHELARIYNDNSVLENRHVSCLYTLVAEHEDANIFSLLDDDMWKEVRRIIIESILHTDMVHHFPMVSKVIKHK